MRSLLKKLASFSGYEIHRKHDDVKIQQYSAEFLKVWKSCEPYTMTSIERGFALWNAALYANRANLNGAYIECGVWRGGSSMIAAYAMLQCGDIRDIYMYDTYEGMSAPTAEDKSIYATESSDARWRGAQRDGVTDWCYASLDDVKANMARTGYPADRITYVMGKVEDTLPEATPGDVAILRLDTDFYASTRAEMEILYPRLVERGVLLIDDYGHWQGAKQAVDEYFKEEKIELLLNRIDYTGRIAVKV